MAGEAKQTTGTVLKSVAPILSAIPIIGTFASGAISGIGAGLEASAAKDQEEQAEKMRRDALATQKQILRPEYLRALRAQKMQALQGLPARELAETNIDENIAANLRSIKESSPQGATATAAISALINKANAEKRKLAIDDANYRADMTGKVTDRLWNIGLQERGLEDRRDLQRTQGLTAAAAMENAATANRMGAINKGIGTVTSTITSLLNNAGQSDNSGFNDWYQSYLQSKSPAPENAGYYAPANSDFNPLLTTDNTATPNAPMGVNNNPYSQYKTPTMGFWQ